MGLSMRLNRRGWTLTLMWCTFLDLMAYAAYRTLNDAGTRLMVWVLLGVSGVVGLVLAVDDRNWKPSRAQEELARLCSEAEIEKKENDDEGQ